MKKNEKIKVYAPTDESRCLFGVAIIESVDSYGIVQFMGMTEAKTGLIKDHLDGIKAETFELTNEPIEKFTGGTYGEFEPGPSRFRGTFKLDAKAGEK